MKRPGDFTDATIRLLGERAGLLCSNPKCRALTKGAHTDDEKVVGISAACHIHAASPDGPRYEESQTPDRRKALENGIWLCASCHSIVDGDEKRFPAPLLRQWKADAEKETAARMDRPRAFEQGGVITRLASIEEGSVARLAYLPLSRRPGGMPHDIPIEWNGLDLASNVARFTCEIGGRKTSHAVPLGDVEEAWCVDGTWMIRVSGYLYSAPLGPHRYMSQPRETGVGSR